MEVKFHREIQSAMRWRVSPQAIFRDDTECRPQEDVSLHVLQLHVYIARPLSYEYS